MSTIVASMSAANLAGDVLKRPNYLKSLILGKTIRSDTRSFGELLNDGFAGSPDTNLDAYYRWCRSKAQTSMIGRIYEQFVGDMTTGSYHSILPGDLEFQFFVHNGSLSSGDAAAFKNTQDGWGYEFVPAVGPANYIYWAYNYWLSHRPTYAAEAATPWTTSYDPATNTITIVNVGDSTYTFTPSGYDPNGRYLYLYSQNTNFGVHPYFIYKIGSGDSFYDAFADAVEDAYGDAGFYSPLPVRMNNTTLAESCAELNAQVDKAYHKVTQGRLSDLVTKIGENPQVGDIDSVAMLFGVQANTSNREARRYIYTYFQELVQRRWANSTERDNYNTANNAYFASIDAWRAWRDSGSVGTAPTISSPVVVPGGTYKMFLDVALPGGWSATPKACYAFDSITELSGAGLQSPSATVGELWWVVSGTTATLYWQVTADKWLGMRLVNYSYFYAMSQTKIFLADHVNATGESPFIIPLHKPTLRAAGKVVAAQTAMEALTLVVLSYEVITASILSGIAFFVMALLIVAFPPAAGTVGLLGTNLAVGVSLGLTGGLAIVAGAVINAVAAMILVKVITFGAKAVFGAQIGEIIGAVVGFVAVSVGTGLSNGMDMSAIWSSMGSAQSLLALTNAVGSGISGYVQAAMNELSGEMVEFNSKADAAFREVQQAYAQNIGYGNALVDPMDLTSSPTYFAETSDSFLTRTLLTGSDIADLSMSMLSDFCSLTTSTNLLLR